MMKSQMTQFIHSATPRAAAIAGILFSIFFAITIILIRLSVPTDPTTVNDWTDATRSQVGLALRLMPFAGIAFLWFVGVVRDRLGEFEDKFFSTVTLGSGLLFLAMSFIAMANGAGMLAIYQATGGQAMSAELYALNRSVMNQIFNTYGLKMAGVFMFSISTLWLRTGVMPRLLCYFTYALVVFMLVTTSQNLWMVLIFPAWVLIVSILILVLTCAVKLREAKMA
ncbi:hypothetical protein ADN00_00675 [Ornatilinea apprima]|uniref:DUF4386 domain-containing protein n=2 Tax=Ornatilinea apprima TaxID=1134406 RepID=A0A0P6XLB2_9CHLR|nr:hypothetical protein ADN00_00675 [Ornatilinea apprima]